MIPKSGGRFSEKIMLKQSKSSDALDPAGQEPWRCHMSITVDMRRSPAPPEPRRSPMIESANQYRDQATRYRALAEQTDCPARQALYRRLERGYLTLADCQDILSRP